MVSNSKQSGKGSEDAGAGAGVVSSPRPVGTIDRLLKRPKSFNRYAFLNPKQSKTKARPSVAKIAKIINYKKQSNSSVIESLRRITRKRKVIVNFDGYTDSSGSEDDNLMVSSWYNSSARYKEKFSSREGLRLRRDRLRPLRSNTGSIKQLILESDDEGDAYEENNDADDGESDDGGAEGDGNDAENGNETEDK